MNTLRFYEKQIQNVVQVRPSDETSARALQFIQAVTVTGDHLQTLKEMGFDIILNTANFETVTL